MKYEPNALVHALAPNFKMFEIAKSSTATRYGIENTPSPEVVDNAIELAVNCLQPIRKQFGAVHVESWYRCEELEKIIAKSGFESWCKKNGRNVTDPKSWDDYFAVKSHPKGEAADIEVGGLSNDVLFEWCKKNLKYDQLIREFPKAGDPMSGWVHISYRKGNNRQMAFTIG